MRWILAFCALVVVTVFVFIFSDSDGPTSPTQGPSRLFDERADPAQFRQGTLNPDAVQTAVTFEAFPVLWLGEEFMGYRLTSAGDLLGGNLALAYGSCERASGETSCTPPLVIINRGPISPGAGGREPFVRGLTTGGLGVGSTTLWTTGGLGIEVQSNADIRDEVLQALVVANGDFFGWPETLPGESLDVLNEWSR